MSATMARQGGRVQLQQSDMCLALNMAKMAQGGYLNAAVEETQQLIQKPCADVWDEKKRGVEFHGHKKVMAAIERHLAMVYKNHMAGCLPCQNGTARNARTRWRGKETGAPPPEGAASLPERPPSAWNATCPTRWHWRKWKLWNRRYAIQVCVFTFSTSKHSIFQS